MYFVELLVKRFLQKQEKKDSYDPMGNDKNRPEDSDFCEHIFMPIDSTGEILSCRNCGMVVSRKDLKDINFFRSKDL